MIDKQFDPAKVWLKAENPDFNLVDYVYALETAGIVKYKSPRVNIKGATIYNGKKLQMINSDNSMDAVISIDYFDSILPKRPMSFDEKRQWLIDNNIIGENAKANTIGYRIPT